jgi:hypothetical protein
VFVTKIGTILPMNFPSTLFLWDDSLIRFQVISATCTLLSSAFK